MNPLEFNIATVIFAGVFTANLLMYIVKEVYYKYCNSQHHRNFEADQKLNNNILETIRCEIRHGSVMDERLARGSHRLTANEVPTQSNPV